MQIAHSSLRATYGLAGAATTELCSLGRFKRAGVGGNCVLPFAEAAGVSVNCSIAHDLGIDNVDGTGSLLGNDDHFRHGLCSRICACHP